MSWIDPTDLNEGDKTEHDALSGAGETINQADPEEPDKEKKMQTDVPRVREMDKNNRKR